MEHGRSAWLTLDSNYLNASDIWLFYVDYPGKLISVDFVIGFGYVCLYILCVGDILYGIVQDLRAYIIYGRLVLSPRRSGGTKVLFQLSLIDGYTGTFVGVSGPYIMSSYLVYYDKI